MKKVLLLLAAGIIGITSVFSQSKAGKTDTSKHALYYSCPHHPDVISTKSGKCRICGMDLKLSGKEEMKASVAKTYVCPVHVDVTSHDPGKCPKCGKAMHLSGKEQMKADVVKLYTCPMHPDVALTKEGICPKCGKQLVEKVKTDSL